MDFDEKAYKTEKKVWIYTTGSGSSWHKPNYSSFQFINDGKPTTEEEAQAEVWEGRCNDCNEDADMELCSSCEGEGCEDCDFEGGYYEEWAEVVERHTYCYLEEYDPEKHYQVPSDRKEYHLWQANKTVEFHAKRMRHLERRMEQLREELEGLEAEHKLHQTKHVHAQGHKAVVEERFA